jgi:hypothetical protein
MVLTELVIVSSFLLGVKVPLGNFWNPLFEPGSAAGSAPQPTHSR